MNESERKCTDSYEKEFEESNHLARFEAWADLYYKRFGRLCPGKSEPMATRRNSSEPENIEQCEAWHKTGLSTHDAIMEVVRLTELREQDENKMENMVCMVQQLLSDLPQNKDWLSPDLERELREAVK